MKAKYKGFTLVEITIVMVLISILIAITTPLVSNVIARNDVGSAHESLYNALLRAQQLSKNQYKDSQWRVCLDNTNKQYTITSGTCSDPTNAEIIKISSNITISSEQTLDILFKSISGELDNTFNSITITLTGGGASKSIIIDKNGVIDKQANTTSASTTTTTSIVTNGLVLNLDAGNINSYPGLSGNGNTWFDLSGNNNNGTLVNGVGYNSGDGGSLVFDGVNDYLSIANGLQSSLQSGATLEMWIRMTSNKNVELLKVGSSGVDTPGSQAFYYISSDTSLRFLSFINGSRTFVSLIYSINLADSNWKHIVGTFNGNVTNGGTATLYINGQSVATSTSVASMASFGGSGFSNNGTIYAFPGNSSALRVYNRALTFEEIQQNFNATKGRFGL